MSDINSEKNTGSNAAPECNGPDCKYWRGSRAWRKEMRHRDPWHGVFWSVLLILLGALFLAGMVYNFNVGQWWPVILIIIGGVFLTRAIWRNNNQS